MSTEDEGGGDWENPTPLILKLMSLYYYLDYVINFINFWME